jgi:hypothetical protein
MMRRHRKQYVPPPRSDRRVIPTQNPPPYLAMLTGKEALKSSFWIRALSEADDINASMHKECELKLPTDVHISDFHPNVGLS